METTTSEACKTEITQNIPPPPDRNVNERVQDGEGHEGNDGGDDQPHAEVHVDDVSLVESKLGRTDSMVQSRLKD